MLDIFKEDYEMFHTTFQIEHFILIKNGKTTYGIYKQCLRELQSRETSLRGLYAQKLRQEIDFEENGINIKEEQNPLEVRRLRITQAELAYSNSEILNVISETEREYTHFYNAALYLKSKLGKLDSDTKEKLEGELWVEQCKYRACTDIRLQGGISGETMNTVDALPNNKRISLIKFFNRIKTPQGADEMNNFLTTYSSNYEFGCNLNESLDFNIKALVDKNGS